MERGTTSLLAQLPSRGIFGTVEGLRPLPAAPGPAYICCQQHSPSVVVSNPPTELMELYRVARKRTGAAGSKRTAAAAAAGGAGAAQPDNRAAKRQMQQQQQQQQQGLAGMQPVRPTPAPAARTQQQQPQQQGVTPLATRPNGVITTAATAAAAAGAGGVHKQLQQLTPEAMMGLSNKQLSELLRACGCRVAGRKEELVRRLLEYQRRVRKAAQGGGAAAAAVAQQTRA